MAVGLWANTPWWEAVRKSAPVGKAGTLQGGHSPSGAHREPSVSQSNFQHNDLVDPAATL